MTSKTRINEDNIFPCLLLGSALVTIVLAAAMAFLRSPGSGASVLAGGLLAIANFLWIRRGLEAALTQLPANASRFALLRYLLRLAIMAVLLYVVIVELKADIWGLLLGLSVLVLNIIAFSIYLSTRKGG
jgi:hypothetical protein